MILETSANRILHNFIGPVVVTLLALLPFSVLSQSKSSGSDSQPPKHYFNTTFLFDGYGKPSVGIDTAGIGKRLKTFSVKQSNLSFYIPLFTEDRKGSGADSNVISNTHLLLTGNFHTLQPAFDGITDHRLTKRGVGLRYIYNTGKKGVWFFDVFPFITRDVTYRSSKPTVRLSSTALYSYNVNEYFNLRIGATRFYGLGNRVLLPFVGIRVGRLDKINASLQFPRSFTFNVPLGSWLNIAAFSKTQGGVYNFSNHDTLYYKPTTATFHFTRFEIISGLRVDCRVGARVNLYGSLGLSNQNRIVFYSENGNKARSKLLPYNTYFYSDSPDKTYFLQFGIVLRLGRTKSYYNNRNIYDAIDINNKTGMYDGNPQILKAPKKLPKNLSGIEDLMDYDDY